MARVELCGIGKAFGAAAVLQGVDLDVPDGEFLTVVGPSGCGKSTLIRIIAGLEPQDAGSVRIGGAAVDHLRSYERNVAMVFQNYALYPHMTVFQNMATPLVMARLGMMSRLPVLRWLSPQRRRILRGIADEVRSVAAQLQIEPLLPRRPGQLSGGQRQRVALGRAMVRHPAAFLMDEPLSNLDAKLRVHMRAELMELHQRLGATFIYVTHDQTEAMTMSDRVAMMDGGQVLQLATPSELYDRPASRKVAEFIGSPAINLFPGSVGRARQVQVLGHDLPVCVDLPPGTAVEVGVRPESLTLHPATQDALAVPARLHMRENLGAEQVLHFRLAAHEALAATCRVGKAEAEAFTPITAVPLYFVAADCHIFAPDGTRGGGPPGCPGAGGKPGMTAGARAARAERLSGIGLALPALILMILINVGPLLVLLGLSVSDYELGSVSSRFVGAENFRHAFADPVIRQSIGNTALYVAIVVPAATVLSLLVALLVHGRKASRAVYEVVFYLPVTSTLVAMATVWMFLLHPSIGPVSHALHAFGVQQTNFLSNPNLVLPTLAVIGVWQLLGFNMILFLAGLSAVPRELYEAAEIDGCRTGIDRFLMVTWPLLGPTTVFVLVTTSITALKVFDTVAVITRGGPMNASQVLLYSIYVEGFEYLKSGYAAALTIIFLVFIVLFAVLQTALADRRVHYG